MAYIIPGLQSARVAAGLTVTQLAHLSNASDLIIQGLENNGLPAQVSKRPFTISQELAQRIAEVLGSDLETLGAIDPTA